MKSNSVLTPQYPAESQLTTERAFLSKQSNSPIKEGLSSDEEESALKASADFRNRSQELLEDIYGTRMAAYGARGQNYVSKTSGKVGEQGSKSHINQQEQSSLAGSGRAQPSSSQPTPGPSQMDKSSVIFLGASERLPSMSNRNFNRTAL